MSRQMEQQGRGGHVPAKITVQVSNNRVAVPL